MSNKQSTSKQSTSSSKSSKKLQKESNKSTKNKKRKNNSKQINPTKKQKLKIIIPKNTIKSTMVTMPIDDLSLQAIDFDNKKIITRFKNFKRCHYVFKCPEKHVKNMVVSIEQNLGLDVPV